MENDEEEDEEKKKQAAATLFWFIVIVHKCQKKKKKKMKKKDIKTQNLFLLQLFFLSFFLQHQNHCHIWLGFIEDKYICRFKLYAINTANENDVICFAFFFFFFTLTYTAFLTLDS